MLRSFGTARGMVGPATKTLTMRFCPKRESWRPFLTLLLMCAMGTAAKGQDRREWQSLTLLHAGDTILMSLKAGPVKGAFRSWTPQQVMAGQVTAQKEDVLKIERYRQSGWGHGKTAFVGAMVGFGAGFAVGAAAGGCDSVSFGPCVGRFAGGAVIGGLGAAVGAGIGALIPRRHTKELIYSPN